MYDHSSTRWLVVLATILFFLSGVLPAFAQGPLPTVSSSRSDRDPDPNARREGRNRSGNLLEVRKSQAIQAGNDARRRFDYKTALDAYSKVKELDPKDARAYYGLGNVYYDVACYDSAIDFYGQALQYNPNYVDAIVRLATSYFGKNRFDDAESHFAAALKLKPNRIDAKLGSLHVKAKKGNAREAIAGINQLIADQSIGKQERASAYIVLGQVYSADSRWQEAITAIEKAKEAIAHERHPSLPLHYFLAGSYFVRAQKTNSDADYEEAIKLLKEVIKTNNAFVDAYFALGNVYKFYKQGMMVNEAVENYEHALKYDPKNPAIYFMLGDLHASVTHNYDAAIKYLNEAIKLKPDYALAYWTLGQVYSEKKDDTEAIRLYLEGLKYWKHVSAYVMLVDIYERQENYVEATRWAQEAIRAEPTTHLPYVIKARLLTRQRKNDEAIHTYEEAIKWLKPDDSANKQLYLCRIIRLREQYPEALACFLKLTHPFPDQVPYDLGVTYVYSGNKQAALAQHQQLVQLKSLLAEDLLKKINEMK